MKPLRLLLIILFSGVCLASESGVQNTDQIEKSVNYIKAHSGKSQIVIVGLGLPKDKWISTYKSAYRVRAEIIQKYGISQDQIRISTGVANIRSVEVMTVTK